MDLDEEFDIGRQEEVQGQAPWQFTLRGLLGATAALAVVCSAVAWWGVPAVAAILGGAAGAFVGALVCPWFGLDYVLDDLRRDVARCLGVGAYLIGGTWAVIGGLGWAIRTVHGDDAPLPVSGGLLVLVMLSVGLVAKMCWPDAEGPEITIITVAAFLGASLGAAVTLPLFVG